MTKEEQKAAAARIMAKLGPLDEREKEVYRRLRAEPGYYPVADRDHRVCQQCGAEFKTKAKSENGPEETAMQQWVEHIARHEPNPGQWAEAYQKIRSGK